MGDTSSKLISLRLGCMLFNHLMTEDHVGYDIGFGGSLPLVVIGLSYCETNARI